MMWKTRGPILCIICLPRRYSDDRVGPPVSCHLGWRFHRSTMAITRTSLLSATHCHNIYTVLFYSISRWNLLPLSLLLLSSLPCAWYPAAHLLRRPHLAALPRPTPSSTWVFWILMEMSERCWPVTTSRMNFSPREFVMYKVLTYVGFCFFSCSVVKGWHANLLVPSAIQIRWPTPKSFPLHLWVWLEFLFHLFWDSFICMLLNKRLV